MAFDLHVFRNRDGKVCVSAVTTQNEYIAPVVLDDLEIVCLDIITEKLDAQETHKPK